MATAGICDQFDIVIQGADLNVLKTFTAPRAFVIERITATNTAAGASTLNVTNAGSQVCGTTAAPPVAGAGVVQAQAAAGPDCLVTVIAANASVAAGATLTVTTGAATVTSVILHCIGALSPITIA
jgi:hypothetical protein